MRDEEILISDRSGVVDVCRFLRTKQTSGTVMDGTVVPWEAGHDTAAAYHCLVTQTPVGPDDQLVHPHGCREGRTCFRRRDSHA